MKRRFGINFTLTIVATIFAFFLSWPYSRSFTYWADSEVAWWLHFAVGFVLAAYVFYVFIDCVQTLFLHEALLKKGVIKAEVDPNQPF